MHGQLNAFTIMFQVVSIVSKHEMEKKIRHDYFKSCIFFPFHQSKIKKDIMNKTLEGGQKGICLHLILWFTASY